MGSEMTLVEEASGRRTVEVQTRDADALGGFAPQTPRTTVRWPVDGKTVEEVSR